MEQFVWSMEGEPVKDLFRYVLMESGDMCVVDMNIIFLIIIGLLLMQEWSVANWDTLQQVSVYSLMISFSYNYCYKHSV